MGYRARSEEELLGQTEEEVPGVAVGMGQGTGTLIREVGSDLMF